MRQFLIQLIAFGVIGLIVYGLSKLLRCRPSPSPNLDARRSSWRGLLAVAASMIALFALMLWFNLRHGPAHGSQPEFTTVSQLLTRLLLGLAGYVMPAAYGMFREREGLASAGIGRLNLWQACVIGLVLAALACCNRPADLPQKLSNLAGTHWIRSLIFFGMVGFGEEFLFRGYLQTRLVAWCGWWRGWVLTAVVFALIHLPQLVLIRGINWGDATLAAIGLLPPALLLGFIMLRTQNIVASGIFHTFINWASDTL